MATAAAAEGGGVTGVHEADAWVDPISRADPSRGKSTKVETLECRLKAPPPCFCLSPYFLFLDSTFFWFLTLQQSYIQGEPKIQAMPGSALIRLSYTTISKKQNILMSYVITFIIKKVISQSQLLTCLSA